MIFSRSLYLASKEKQHLGHRNTKRREKAKKITDGKICCKLMCLAIFLLCLYSDRTKIWKVKIFVDFSFYRRWSISQNIYIKYRCIYAKYLNFWKSNFHEDLSRLQHTCSFWPGEITLIITFKVKKCARVSAGLSSATLF